MPSTQNLPISLSLIETLKQGNRRETTFLDLSQNPLPSHLGIDDEFIPNLVLDFRDVPLLLVKTLVVAFNPNGPKCDTSKVAIWQEKI